MNPLRGIPVVLASLDRACTVCGSDRAVRIVAFPGLAMHGGGTATCPHCSAEPGRAPIPIYLYPLYRDVPRGGAA